MSAAVYGASEGLSLLVLDAQAFGGQAGASARIENYFGFPLGISGHDLTGRGTVQAEKFGAQMEIPVEAVRLDCSVSPFGIVLSDGRTVRATTVLLASGARYHRPDVPHLADFEGRGVWYWASPIEARLCRQEEIALIGGGNSAGQAAVFLRQFAAKIWMLVRGPSLAEHMSQYLIDRIGAADNIEVLTRTELVALSGSREGQLERVRWRHMPTGEETEKPIRNLFLFTGADPATAWLDGCGVERDGKGFVRTGISGASPTREGVGQHRPAVLAGDQRARGVRDRRRPLGLRQTRGRGDWGGSCGHSTGARGAGEIARIVSPKCGAAARQAPRAP